MSSPHKLERRTEAPWKLEWPIKNVSKDNIIGGVGLEEATCQCNISLDLVDGNSAYLAAVCSM